jgi:hypothetical protein
MDSLKRLLENHENMLSQANKRLTDTDIDDVRKALLTGSVMSIEASMEMIRDEIDYDNLAKGKK